MTIVDSVSLEKALSLLQEAISADGADHGNIQYYNKSTGSLHILVHHGFTKEFLDHFAEVKAFDSSACGRCVGIGSTIVIEDVNHDKGFAKHRHIAKNAGFRAVKSTPIFGKNKEIVGVLSTHFREPQSRWNNSKVTSIIAELGVLLQATGLYS